MKESVPLNEEQRRLATDNHNLVFAFLKEKDLPEDDYYDVVIFGYLQAINEYTTKPALQKYSLATISWRSMESRLKNHYKAASAPKHRAQLVSLYAPADNSALTWAETLAAMDDCMAELETELLLHELARRLPHRQMRILRMKTDGYGMQEIARQQKTTVRSIRSILDDAYDVVVAVCSS